jgi:hypothetical protein
LGSYREALLVPYTLGRTLKFPMLRELIGYLLWVVFCDFFDIFLFVGKGSGYREIVGNALRTLAADTQPFSKFREQNYFLLPYLKIFHNSFPYFFSKPSKYYFFTFTLFFFPSCYFYKEKRVERRENRVYDYNNHWECYSASQCVGIGKHCSIPNA